MLAQPQISHKYYQVTSPPKDYFFSPKRTIVLATGIESPFYLIKKGIIKQVVYSEDGQERTFALLGAGDLLWNFNQDNIGVIALSSTQINCLSLEQMQHQLQLPTTASVFNVFRQQYQQIIQLFEISQQPPSQQIYNSLLRIAQLTSPTLNTEIHLPPWTQKELPLLTGLSVWTVSKILAKFKEKGIIKGRRGKLIFCPAN